VPDQKRPVDRLLDVFVYAPLGLVLNLEEVLPQLVEKGHQQVNMARMFGKFAVDAGSKEASKRVGPLVEQATDLVSQAGGLAGRRTPAPPAAPETPTPSPVSVADAAGEHAAPELVPDAGSLGITDYDALSASQVVPRLDGLAAAELDAVRRYEAAHRGRKTILAKIAQLQG
jgi:hypothetical protein